MRSRVLLLAIPAILDPYLRRFGTLFKVGRTPRISCGRPVLAEGRARGVPLPRVPWGRSEGDRQLRLFYGPLAYEARTARMSFSATERRSPTLRVTRAFV
jgi:hypothetical protein